MTHDPVYTYAEKDRALREATHRLGAMIERVQGLAAALENWQRIVITDAGIEFPAELILLSSMTEVSVKSIPTVQDLARAMVEWHSARSAAQHAYDSVPDSEREDLTPPPVVA
jgi:hypothetical protein